MHTRARHILESMIRDDIVRFVENRRAAARREDEERAMRPESPADAVAAALALVALYERLHGWPPADDPVSRRDVEAVRGRFARLRRWYARAL